MLLEDQIGRNNTMDTDYAVHVMLVSVLSVV